MTRITCFALLAVLVAVASADAGIVINKSEGVTIPALPGYKSFTLTAVSDGAAIQGFDFTGDPSAPVDANSRGFFGPLSQLNPAGFATVFNDNNALIPALLPGHTSAEDSQFLFKSTDLLVIPGSATESSTSLRGAFSTTTNFGQSIAFAQLVIPDASNGTVTYKGVVGTTDGAEFNIEGSIVNGGVVPNAPPVIAGGGVIPVNLSTASPPTSTTASFQFQVTADDNLPTPGLTWSVQSFTGPGVLTGATVNGSGLLSWPADGSKGGIYTATVRATDQGGLFGEASVQFNLTVPEPATMSLFGLALVGFVGFARKRS